MKPYSILLALPMLLASCGGGEHSPKLTGTIADADSTLITAYYDIDGDSYMEDFSTDSVGNFTYNPDLAKGTDLTLSINGRIYGVRLENGNTTNLSIDAAGEPEFTGDNVAESRWLTECYNGYNSLRYKHVEARDGAYDPAKYMSMADEAKANTEALLPEVKNDSLRAYYERLGNQFYNRTKGTIISFGNFYGAFAEDEKPSPEELKALMDVDPNDDVARRTGALFDWSRSIRPATQHNSTVDFTLDIIGQIDSLVTNPANSRYLINSMVEMVFRYPLSLEKLKEFAGKVSPRLSAHEQEVIADMIAEIEARVKDGDKIPVDPVIMLPDGTKKSLTEACDGKVAYIDMWATWCAPCCAQIPFMEKVAEHFKGSDKVVCISISCDEDLAAWHKKLDQDKPEWPNYVFQGESGQQFMNALGVNGIPRFIVLSPDMTISRLDAPRPQNTEEVIALLDSIASK